MSNLEEFLECFSNKSQVTSLQQRFNASLKVSKVYTICHWKSTALLYFVVTEGKKKNEKNTENDLTKTYVFSFFLFANAAKHKIFKINLI